MRLVPTVALLAHRVTCRIFQDQTTAEIVDAVLAPHGIERRWDLSRALPKRPYCVQYHESGLETVRVRAERSVVLECGESSIELTPDGIRIRGRDIRTIGTELASMQSKGSTGPSLIATDQIEIAAKEIHLFGEDSRLSLTKEAELTSGKKTVVMGGGAGLGLAGGATLAGGKVIVAGKGATLVLDAEAKLDGAMVKLNCGGEGGGVSVKDRDPKKLDTPRDVVMKKIMIRALDSDRRPMPGKHLRAQREGLDLRR